MIINFPAVLWHQIIEEIQNSITTSQGIIEGHEAAAVITTGMAAVTTGPAGTNGVLGTARLPCMWSWAAKLLPSPSSGRRET